MIRLCGITVIFLLFQIPIKLKGKTVVMIGADSTSNSNDCFILVLNGFNIMMSEKEGD